MTWNTSQQLALALVPKFSSILSLAGSTWILVEVLTEGRKIRNVYNRLLGVMAVYDILESCFNFASTWPIPKGTENVWNPLGTTATCVAQGFFLQFSLGVPLYNACLSIYYLLIIRYGATEEKIRRRVEPAMHAVCFLVAGGTAFAAVGLNLFNNANLWCWIAPLPADCKDSLRYPAEEANCERGDNAWLYRWIFYFIPLWICIGISIVATFMFYCSVKKRESATFHYRQPTLSRISLRNNSSFSDNGNRLHSSITDLYNSGSISNQLGVDSEPQQPGTGGDGADDSSNNENSRSRRSSMLQRASSTSQAIQGATRRLRRRMSTIGNDPQHNPRSKEVFHQAIFYTFAFWMTHLFSTLNRTVQLVRGDTFFVIILLHSWFDPLQGFTNFVVYRRPRYMKYRKRNQGMSRWKAIWWTLRWSFMGPPKESTTKKQRRRNRPAMEETAEQTIPQDEQQHQPNQVYYSEAPESDNMESSPDVASTNNDALVGLPSKSLQPITEEEHSSTMFPLPSAR